MAWISNSDDARKNFDFHTARDPLIEQLSAVGPRIRQFAIQRDALATARADAALPDGLVRAPLLG